ncbi:hypothetical protein GCM10010123_02620 [Pilimelia anulata]|uniref:Uncharacterized protein n=1 Tax=Pilimelia anulata TaxID=53371 RepID=A0A8J3FAM9_9ACTN|nr:type 4a pilus biogenesis protein PilO [Pilimelia anulata]GGJ76115.1 hypothetical protein GCM10010123_02620 [Pilimelia anulata]
MENRASADRTWLLIGVAGALGLLGLGWVLLLGPALTDLGKQHDRTEAAEMELAQQQSRLSQLRRENTELTKYQAELAAAEQALPTDAGLPAFLRSLQSLSSMSGVTVTNLTVSPPVAAKQPGTIALPISLTVRGPAAATEAFLGRVQDRGRAVLIGGVSTSIEGSETSMTLNMQAYTATR